jgi:RNA polymerase sigma factor (sigma-70 family)
MTDWPRSFDSAEDLESTAVLLLKARDGDGAAVNRLFDRYYPLLRRIAHGRLSNRQRTLTDTDDLVQMTLFQAFKSLDRFEYRREGAFLAYLRTILLNEIRQEVRRSKRRPVAEPLLDDHVDPGKTPAREAEERMRLERFERALGELSEDQYEAILLRIEFGFSYEQIARDLQRPSANAARMLVVRALARVAQLMNAASSREPADP